MNTTSSRAVIDIDPSGEVLAYAARELRSFLETTTALSFDGDAAGPDRWTFRLQIDPALPQGGFACSGDFHDEARPVISLRGADATCVLHAVYTMLERGGVCFDVDGPILPPRLQLDRLRGYAELVRPAVKERGVRVVLNFPMDISSYPLAEACEYVRNLARMRMNHITFRTHTGHWIPFHLPGKEIPAGKFFYGHRHEIPRGHFLGEHVRNRDVFCIPEIEPYMGQEQECSRAAVEWLRAVMLQAKRAGMSVRLTLTPPGDTTEDFVAACRSAREAYPMIDALELVTPEAGGSSAALPVDGVRKLLAELFGEGILDHPEVISPLTDKLPQLPGTLRSLARCIAAVDTLLKDGRYATGLRFSIGVFNSCNLTLRVVKAILYAVAPAETTFTFLPSYGSQAATEAMRAMRFTAEEWRRAIIYSWAEFDGLMYVQQNPVGGIQAMLEDGRRVLGDEPIPAIGYIHWRNSENRTALRYAALASICGPLEADSFYTGYGESLGIADLASFSAAMQLLDATDIRCRDDLFNIGFCFAGCWMGPPGLDFTRGWTLENLAAVRQAFRQVRDGIEACLPGTRSVDGRIYLRFLVNRLQCTDLHLQAVGHLVALHPHCDDQAPGKTGVEGRRLVLEHTRAALELTEAYLRCHAQAIRDRGCEGTLVSYMATIVPYIDRIRSMFGGDGLSYTSGLDTGDAPPAPVLG
jgi:hypothetical protein